MHPKDCAKKQTITNDREKGTNILLLSTQHARVSMRVHPKSHENQNLLDDFQAVKNWDQKWQDGYQLHYVTNVTLGACRDHDIINTNTSSNPYDTAGVRSSTLGIGFPWGYHRQLFIDPDFLDVHVPFRLEIEL